MNPLGIKEFDDWEKLSQRPTIVYCPSEHPSKPLDNSDGPILYECLQAVGVKDSLDVVFYCNGGYVNAARRLMLTLRQNYGHIRVIVPYRAHSAGTLFCLGANEIVAGPMTEFSPIDPHFAAPQGQTPSGAPVVISAEDVRAYREMADSWFGLSSKEDRTQIFALLSKHFFPTSLSSFYRAEKEVRDIGLELIGFQLPDVDISVRKAILEKLLSGFHSHDYWITRNEALSLGLRIESPSIESEAAMWRLYKACQHYMKSISRAEQESGVMIGGVMFTSKYGARYVIHSSHLQKPQPFDTDSGAWEVV